MEGKKLYCVIGDIGSAREMLAAVKALEAKGFSNVRWFADPVGKGKDEVLAKAGIPFEKRDPDPKKDSPCVFFIGTNGTATAAQYQYLWSKFGEAKKIPVLWLEDIWGGANNVWVNDVNPDLVFANDEMAKEAIKSVRPNVRVEVVGKPSFEDVPDYLARYGDILMATRQKMGLDLGTKDFLVTYYSGGELERTETVLRSLLALADATPLRDRMALCVRLHPKLPEKAKIEKLLDGLWWIYIIEAKEMKVEYLNIASNIVVAGWGATEGYRTMLFGNPVILALFPPDEKMLNAGFANNEPPMVRSRAAWGATNPQELALYANEIAVDFETARRKVCEARDKCHGQLVQPGAAGRIADVLLDSLK